MGEETELRILGSYKLIYLMQPKVQLVLLILLIVASIEFKEFSALSWNIRGAVNLTGKRHSRELTRKYRPSMVIMMEIHCTFSRASNFWQGLGYEACGLYQNSGHAGGLWVLVEKGSGYDISVMEVYQQAVTVSVRKSSREWFCMAVYASLIPVSRELFWAYLSHLRANINGLWLLMGDFNGILLPSEVKGGHYSLNNASKFAGMMEECGLLDLGATSSSFTWYRKNEGLHRISKRLERAISDCNWRNMFPEAYVENLNRLQSDHRPILLRCCRFTPPKKDKPFHFQVAWLTHKDFPRVVRYAWEKGGHSVMHGLKHVKDDASDFNSRVFGNIFRKKKSLEAHLKDV